MNERRLDSTTKTVKVQGLEIGGNNRQVIIAGPCSIESKEQMEIITSGLKSVGVDIIRGGSFKPRTSPYDFQGLGKEGVKILYEVGKRYKIPVVTEVLDESNLDFIAAHVDILQIGARNMHNSSLLKAVGSLNKPTMLKRGISATINEWIYAAEYIASSGNTNIILCERGIRTYEKYTRNTLDLSSIIIMQKETGLPVIVDPSHGTGIRELVCPMSKAALICGAHGVMIEVHNEPSKALSDGEQSLDLAEYGDFKKQVDVVMEITCNDQTDKTA